ncbi:nucleotidyltransferase family protein [Rhodobacteraceae bacterium KMM 6894]|nr:nucleotidyltransferase family protein [Rhodobacteraceae bacterium KMM 6894]
MLAILMPAAGASTRMEGRDKLMERINDVPLLVRQVGRALSTGAPVFVTTRVDRPARIAALAGLACGTLTCVPVAGPDTGLSASLRAGVDALPANIDRVMILLPDLPDIQTTDLTAMIDAHGEHPETVLRGCTAVGAPGHPVILPRAWFARLRALTGDAGMGTLLSGAWLHPLPGTRARTDLDTPADWIAWRIKNGL